MTRREAVVFTAAIIMAYAMSFGAVAYAEYEGEEMRQITTTIELTDNQYANLEHELAVLKKDGQLPKHWSTSSLAGVYANAGVSYHLNRYMESLVDEQNKYYVSSPEIRAADDAPVTVNEKTTVDKRSPFDKQPGFGEDIDELFLRCIQAEAGNQPYEGKLAVAEVIRNRLNSEAWPSTVEGVITQPGQFTVVDNGMIWNVTPDDDTIKAAAAALTGSATLPTDYVYFNTSPIGSDCIQIGAHWFGR